MFPSYIHRLVHLVGWCGGTNILFFGFETEYLLKCDYDLSGVDKAFMVSRLAMFPSYYHGLVLLKVMVSGT